MTQAVSDPNSLGNEAKGRFFGSYRSSHSFHLDCRRSNSMDSDLLVLNVLRSHLDDVMTLLAEASVLEQRVQEMASSAARHAQSVSAAVEVEVDSSMLVLLVVAGPAVPLVDGT
jgi:hypothetical protein